MSKFLKRTLIALTVVTPFGLVYAGVVSQSHGSGDLQYWVGNDGEYCKHNCFGKNFICCTIGTGT